MKNFSLLLLLACIALFASPSHAGDEGIWGGKWDDTWPVFLEIKKSESGDYVVEYIWKEGDDDTDFTRRIHDGKKVDGRFEAAYLIFKLDDANGIMYGAFRKPRMANLVRLESVPTLANADSALQKAGWKAEAIPAAEALDKIKGK